MNKPAARGVALVELAILLPLLLALFFGVAEFGRALLLEQQLLRQVESAARYLGRSPAAALDDCTPGAAWSSATATAAALVVHGSESGGTAPLIRGMSSSNVSATLVARTVPGNAPACVVQVAASVAYPSIFGATVPVLGLAQPTLRAQSEERYVGE